MIGLRNCLYASIRFLAASEVVFSAKVGAMIFSRSAATKMPAPS
jgi:hypothetical protein